MQDYPIYVTNASTRVSDSDVAAAVTGVWTQVYWHAAPAWRKTPITVKFVPASGTVPTGARGLVVKDNSDTPGVLGWHTEDPSVHIYGYVFAGPILDNGGNALTNTLSVSSVLSHEVLETFVDETCNLWADDHNGSTYALEVGDPVESTSYMVNGVSVSNFVLPAWFDPNAAPTEKFDWLGQVKAPFTIQKNGYCVKATQGTVTQVLGEDFPEWRHHVKGSRAAYRGLQK